MERLKKLLEVVDFYDLFHEAKVAMFKDGYKETNVMLRKNPEGTALLAINTYDGIDVFMKYAMPIFTKAGIEIKKINSNKYIAVGQF